MAGDAVLQVKVTLRGTEPPIWRRLRVPAAATLGQVHEVIQASFGWDDSHLHLFEAGGRRYGQPEYFGDDPDDDLDEGSGSTIEESEVRLGEVLSRSGDGLRYTYDFGDDWQHDVLVEKVLPADGVGHAVCVTGRRAAPPEDCGGVWGYAALCETLADPTHPEHAERAEWMDLPDGTGFDPSAFDQDAINQTLATIRIT